jgi:CheY-like chemotaxis protein
MNSRKRILLVDDDRDYVRSLEAYLRAGGYEVLTARNGLQGLRMAQLHLPDLIVMDVIMDERTEGFFTLQDLRQIPALEKTPVFIASAVYSEVEGFQVAPETKWLPYDEFFVKPLDFPNLLERIRERIGPGKSVVTAEVED